MSKAIGLGTFNATPETYILVNQVLRSGRLSYGPLSREFEQRFAALHGCKYGVLSNSGTSSLLVALQTLKELHGWQDGDEVIVPALTFVATVNVVLQLRLKPVLVDIEPDYYGIDTCRIEDRAGHKTRCIMPVHTFGQPCSMITLRSIATRNNFKVIEDSCEAMMVGTPDAMGAGVVPVGAWGDIGVFSTYIAHLLVTGVGGLATTNNPDYYQCMRSLVHHGIDLSELPTGQDYDTSWLARKFSFDKVGHSFRITEIESALGLAQLDNLSDIIKKRQSNAAYLNKNLKPLEDKELLQLPQVRPDTKSSWMMYCLVCKQEGARDNLMRFLNDKEISTRLALPLTNQPVYRGLFIESDYPVAAYMNRNAFYLGCHQELYKDDMDYIIESLFSYYGC